MPTLNINKFFGLHDGTPEQPGFASKCDNFLISDDHQMTRRSGIAQVISDECPNFGDFTGVFTLPSPDFLAASPTETRSELSERTVFAVTGGRLYAYGPTGWVHVNGPRGYLFAGTAGCDTMHVTQYNDLAILSYTNYGYKGTKNIVLYHNTSVTYPGAAWQLRPTYAFDMAFASNVPSGGTGVGYVYALVQVLEFTTHTGTTYRVPGKPQYIQSTQRINTLSFSGAGDNGTTPDHVPVDNGTSSEYKIEIYRTINNGTTLYKIHEENNDFGLSYVDDTLASGHTDAEITDGQIIYSQSGEIENDQFTFQSYLHTKTSNDIFWQVNSSTGRIQQSKPGQFGAWPGSFETTPKDTVIALNSVDRYPVFFTRRGCYRIEGFLTADGNGSSRTVTISDSIGTFNQESVVQVDKALYFLSDDGVYVTNGFEVKKVSKHINKTYARYFQAYDKDITSTTYDISHGAFSSVYDDVNKMIFWTIKNQNNIEGTEVIFIGYPEIKIPMPDGSAGIAFTTMSGLPFGKPVLGYMKNILLIADEKLRGISTTTKKSDPDLSEEDFTDEHPLNIGCDQYLENSGPSDPYYIPVLFNYLSTPMDFGSAAKKYIAKATYHLNKLTNAFFASFHPYGINDVAGRHEVADVRQRQENSSLMVHFNRHMPSGFLRMIYKQFGITEAYVITHNSDDYGLATISGLTVVVVGAGFSTDLYDRPSGGKYAVGSKIPSDGNTATWPNARIYFETDGYTQGYDIRTNAADNITLMTTSPGDIVGVKWIVKMVPLDEHIQVSGVEVDFEGTGNKARDYTSDRAGDNG